MDEDIEFCPKCGGRICSIPVCPTYMRNRTVWSCQPPCGDATEYWCESCDWEYIDGLNPKNPKFAENEKNKPSAMS